MLPDFVASSGGVGSGNAILELETGYAKTVSRLFAEVTYHIIVSTGLVWMTSADLLSKGRNDLPSWVPDWSNDFASYDPESVLWELPFLFNASDTKFCDVSKAGVAEPKFDAWDHCWRLLTRSGYL